MTASAPALPLPRDIPLAELFEDPANARTHDARNLETITGSLRRFGQILPLVAMPDGRVVAGNGRLRAMKAIGWATARVIVLDAWTDQQAAAYAIVDNRSSDTSSFDEAVLAQHLLALPDDIRGDLGFDPDELALLLRPEPTPPGAIDDAGPGDLPIDATTRTGDTWLLGRHRLVCGDARLRDDLRALLDDERAACMWTDPPYGVSYVGKTADALTIDNDGAEGLEELITEAFAAANDEGLQDGARIYVAHPGGALSVTFGVAFLATGWRLHETLVWVKDSMVLGHSDYHYRHEPILYGFKPGPAGSGRWGRGGAGWYGTNSETSVLEVDRPKRSELHPTTKPTALIVRCLQNSTQPGDIVLDPFGGSGSTLLACEMLDGRSARLLEIDPRYCDVIVQRWQQATGHDATLAAKGSPTFSKVALNRAGKAKA
jgi:DNA modification methylase